MLTQYRSDGLGELMLQRWVNGGARLPLPVHGPEGVDSVVSGLRAAYALDGGYRVSHHGDAVVPRGGLGGVGVVFDVAAAGSSLVWSDGGVEVTGFLVDHGPVRPAVGYRVSYRGRSVAISGDTVYSQNVVHGAQDVDVLLHEALSERLVNELALAAHAAGRENLRAILDDIPGYHSTPEVAAAVAHASRARMLVLHHIVPPLVVPGSAQAFLGDAGSVFSGPIRIAEDGDLISLPANSNEIVTTRLL